MADSEIYSSNHLLVDRGEPIGNSIGNDGRRALHVKDTLQLVNVPYDTGTVSYPDLVTEVYQYRSGGIAGAIVATVTIVYTDSSKSFISSWAKS